jgi:hypothetical protein
MEVKIKQGNEMLDATIEMVDGVMVVLPKEVKWKPRVGDTYFRPDFNSCMFMCYEGKCRYDTMRYIKDCVEKGWVFRTKEECQEFCKRLNDAISQVKP